VGCTLLFAVTIELALEHATRFASIKFPGGGGGDEEVPTKRGGFKM
jgi:hypothetical protein